MTLIYDADSELIHEAGAQAASGTGFVSGWALNLRAPSPVVGYFDGADNEVYPCSPIGKLREMADELAQAWRDEAWEDAYSA